mmetsp:Transcript_27214/g.66045  ORF Transcript_27214/g.66045 Transcript_27214/m.66045 type:complete len:95 (-) Transcript_27214:1135-1419(-)
MFFRRTMDYQIDYVMSTIPHQKSKESTRLSVVRAVHATSLASFDEISQDGKELAFKSQHHRHCMELKHGYAGEKSEIFHCTTQSSTLNPSLRGG